MEKQNSIDYLIIGGGVAGTSAAETVRKADAKCSITIVSDEPYRFYSRIMLSKPNFFLGKIPFESVWLKKESWYKDNNVSLMAGKSAIHLDPKVKTVSLNDGTTLSYRKLLLAPGTTPNLWPGHDAEIAGVSYLRTLDDAKAIISSVKSAKKAVVIGGGFVGFEMCEMLRMAGLDVTLLIREGHFWDFLWDETSGIMVEQALTSKGINVMTKTEVKNLIGGKKIEGVKLKNGQQLPCDLLVIGIGTHSPLAWMMTSGLATNRGILANEFLETNLPDVWTAGDCAEFYDLILKERIQLGNWVNAQQQGRIAGANMMGSKQPFKLVSFYTTQGFGITIAFVGDAAPKPDRKIISRGSLAAGSYGRILVNNNRIAGATLINRTAELSVISKLIENQTDLTDVLQKLSDPDFDLKSLLAVKPATTTPSRPGEKLRIGWFSFSCCEDNTVVMTEVMNDHWREWKKLFDFRHARVLQSKNVLDDLDIAFIEGAIASEDQARKLREIRSKSRKLVAVGACALQGMPAGQRNLFNEDQLHRIDFLIARFSALPKVQKVSDVVPVDASIPGCPMDPKNFLDTIDQLVKELRP